MLKSGRAEYILHERWQAEWQARVQGIALTVQEPPLARTPMYIYLHRRHADLVPRVAAELAAMKAEGRDKALMAKVMARAGSGPQK
jgi:polar amino acid transport system substrate-binding protein